MKATIKHDLDKRRAVQDGKYPLKLRVFFNRTDRRYSIGITLSVEEYSNLMTDKKLRKTLLKITAKIEQADEIIEDLDENFSFDNFEKRFFKDISAHNSGTNLITLVHEYELMLKENKQFKSFASYRSTRNHLKDFAKKRILYLSNTTPKLLEEFEDYLLSNGLSKSSVGVYMRNIRAVYNKAIKDKLVNKDIYPFGQNGYTPPATKKAKKALTLDDVKKIYEYESSVEKEMWAKDMWLFAYLCSGINIKDICLLRYKDIRDGEITFYRAKTENTTKGNLKEIKIIINDDIQSIINKHGVKPISPDKYIFGLLNKGCSDEEVYKKVNQVIKTINKYLKVMAGEKKANLSRIPTTNFARHTFSTVLKNAGIPIALISEQLGHSSITTTEIYLSSFEKDKLLEASKHLTAFKSKIS